MRHFDVVLADFENAVERRVGTVVQVSDETIVEKDVEARFVEVVTSVLNRVGHLPAEEALQNAARIMSGSRVSSTRVHDDDDCPFACALEVPMEKVHLGQGLLL